MGDRAPEETARPMIQPIALQFRTPALAIGALAIGMFGGYAFARAGIGVPTAPATIVVSPPTLAPRPAVQLQQRPATSACENGAYVTGDMAGDTSPAAVLATMCGAH
jgi:hypothetical protein